MKNLLLLYFSLPYYASYGLAHGSTTDCPSKANSGLVADFYTYPLTPGTVGEPKSWFLEKVNTTKHLGTQPNVTAVSFHFKEPSSPETIGYVYGFPVTLAHFAMVLTGFFKPAKSAEYVFGLSKVDDGASIQVGSGMEASCCSEDFNAWVDSDDMMIRYYGDPNVERKYYMRKELYYPIRIVYYNHRGSGSLRFTISVANSLDSRSDINEGELLGPAGGQCPGVIPTSTLRSNSRTSSFASSSALSSGPWRSLSALSSSFTTIGSTTSTRPLSSSTFSNKHSTVRLTIKSITSSPSCTSFNSESHGSSATRSSAPRCSSSRGSRKANSAETFNSSELKPSASSRHQSSASDTTRKMSSNTSTITTTSINSSTITTTSINSPSITTTSSLMSSSSSVGVISSSTNLRSWDSSSSSSSRKDSSGFKSSKSIFSFTVSHYFNESSSTTEHKPSVVPSTSSTVLTTKSSTWMATDPTTHSDDIRSQSSSLKESENNYYSTSSVESQTEYDTHSDCKSTHSSHPPSGSDHAIKSSLFTLSESSSSTYNQSSGHPARSLSKQSGTEKPSRGLSLSKSRFTTRSSTVASTRRGMSHTGGIYESNVGIRISIERYSLGSIMAMALLLTLL